MKRYVVEEGSKSGHCCFEWSVIDTNKAKYDNAICEVFEKEDAENICNLLNNSIDSVYHP